ncbi:MAG: helix-turn-helix domain-containing protein [Lysobacterales bacterium]
MPRTGPRLQVHQHDSVLGRWMVAVWTPLPALQDLVATMWFGAGSVHYARDRILPSGQSQLLINLGPPQYRIDPGPPARRIPFRDIWYCGLQQGPIDTEAPHGNALLGVAFAAHGSCQWLASDVREYGNRIVPLSDALGDGVLDLRERLLNMESLAARFACVEAWLLARLRPADSVHPAVRWCLRRIASANGQTSVEALARESGYTRKHLNALFQRQVGLGPKALAQVHRFRHAIAKLTRQDQVPWAELASECGYYDQSHLLRDFKAHSGYAPGDLLRRARPDAGSVVVE